MKKETLQEFLARGGKINVIPTVKPEDEKAKVRSTAAKPCVTILSYEEANLLFGTKTDRKKKQKSINPQSSKKLDDLKLSIDALPKELRERLKKNL